ncbi:MAG: hypothetical protein WAQ53_11055 [Thiofilum sp.]|uniref:hypothetical protein n=1 Tax=Thiofilum sp. TaxID=2212733 RepID=UPI0025DBC9CE|nr:hypothetical protein [Thiofilum sp.]MBK8452710.1 hypothetical protein [Thiofilum sp.]
MKIFDRIDIQEINGFRELFAWDNEKNEAYLLRNPVISSESSIFTGYRVSINSIKKRSAFLDEQSMKQFCDEFMKKAYELNTENHKKKYDLPLFT